jgi:hypothetical protein
MKGNMILQITAAAIALAGLSRGGQTIVRTAVASDTSTLSSVAKKSTATRRRAPSQWGTIGTASRLASILSSVGPHRVAKVWAEFPTK